MIVLCKLLSRLPLSVLYLLSDLVCPIVHRVLRYRRGTVRKNLAIAFPDHGFEELARIERDFYRFLCDCAVEIVAAMRLPASELRRRVKLVNPEIFQHLLDEQRPILFLSAHKGNWEWMQFVVADYLPCPMHTIYKPLHDGDFDELMFATRSRFGVNMVAFEDAGRELVRQRRQFQGFAMLADQAPGRRDQRYWAPFFGREAPFYLGPQKIARLGQYPVVYGDMRRAGRGYYELHFELVAEPPYPRTGEQMLDRYIQTMERNIRREPAVWLWSHRKWKRRMRAGEASAG